jgi:hypothetical protein
MRAALSRRERFAKSLSTVGVLSLQVFVAHTMASAAVRIFLLRGLDVEGWLVHITAGLVAGILGPMLLVEALDRLRFRHAFSWPAPSEL